MAVSKYSHDILSWGGPQVVSTPVANIAASQALTTVQAAYTMSPLAYSVMYDIVVHWQAINVNGGTIIVDVYNTAAAGTSANSFFSTNLSIATTSANPQTFSVRLAGGLTAGGMVLLATEIGNVNDYAWPAFVTANVFKAGTPLSVRCSTPAGASITGLVVSMNMFSSDLPNLKY
jgi:F0F1-type ATP synthase membrane subunit a